MKSLILSIVSFNHLPIFGSILGSIVLFFGLITERINAKKAAYILFILSSLGAGVAYFAQGATGVPAKNIQGVVEATIKVQEEFSSFTFISLTILGLAFILGLLLRYNSSFLTRSAD